MHENTLSFLFVPTELFICLIVVSIGSVIHIHNTHVFQFFPLPWCLRLHNFKSLGSKSNIVNLKIIIVILKANDYLLRIPDSVSLFSMSCNFVAPKITSRYIPKSSVHRFITKHVGIESIWLIKRQSNKKANKKCV